MLWRFSNVTVQDLLEDSRRAPAASRVHGLPPPADGGGGRPRERRAGLYTVRLGGAQEVQHRKAAELPTSANPNTPTVPY